MKTSIFENLKPEKKVNYQPTAFSHTVVTQIIFLQFLYLKCWAFLTEGCKSLY